MDYFILQFLHFFYLLFPIFSTLYIFLSLKYSVTIKNPQTISKMQGYKNHYIKLNSNFSFKIDHLESLSLHLFIYCLILYPIFFTSKNPVTNKKIPANNNLKDRIKMKTQDSITSLFSFPQK